MQRNTRRIVRLAAVLVALAASVGIAQDAVADSGSVGLARGILETQFGFSPSRAVAWTTGVCTYVDKPASCYLTQSQARATSLAEAQALGVYRNMAPSQAHDWSVGVCSYADKPSSCYLTPAEATAQSKALAHAMGADRLASPASTEVTTSTSGFSWGDAGIGAAAMLGLVLLLVGIGVTIARRRVRTLRHA
jgi:hypothetical protein